MIAAEGLVHASTLLKFLGVQLSFCPETALEKLR